MSPPGSRRGHGPGRGGPHHRRPAGRGGRGGRGGVHSKGTGRGDNGEEPATLRGGHRPEHDEAMADGDAEEKKQEDADRPQDSQEWLFRNDLTTVEKELALWKFLRRGEETNDDGSRQAHVAEPNVQEAKEEEAVTTNIESNAKVDEPPVNRDAAAAASVHSDPRPDYKQPASPRPKKAISSQEAHAAEPPAKPAVLASPPTSPSKRAIAAAARARAKAAAASPTKCTNDDSKQQRADGSPPRPKQEDNATKQGTKADEATAVGPSLSPKRMDKHHRSPARTKPKGPKPRHAHTMSPGPQQEKENVCNGGSGKERPVEASRYPGKGVYSATIGIDPKRGKVCKKSAAGTDVVAERDTKAKGRTTKPSTTADAAASAATTATPAPVTAAATIGPEPTKATVTKKSGTNAEPKQASALKPSADTDVTAANDTKAKVHGSNSSNARSAPSVDANVKVHHAKSSPAEAPVPPARSDSKQKKVQQDDAKASKDTKKTADYPTVSSNARNAPSADAIVNSVAKDNEAEAGLTKAQKRNRRNKLKKKRKDAAAGATAPVAAVEATEYAPAPSIAPESIAAPADAHADASANDKGSDDAAASAAPRFRTKSEKKRLKRKLAKQKKDAASNAAKGGAPAVENSAAVETVALEAATVQKQKEGPASKSKKDTVGDTEKDTASPSKSKQEKATSKKKAKREIDAVEPSAAKLDASEYATPASHSTDTSANQNGKPKQKKSAAVAAQDAEVGGAPKQESEKERMNRLLREEREKAAVAKAKKKDKKSRKHDKWLQAQEAEKMEKEKRTKYWQGKITEEKEGIDLISQLVASELVRQNKEKAPTLTKEKVLNDSEAAEAIGKESKTAHTALFGDIKGRVKVVGVDRKDLNGRQGTLRYWDVDKAKFSVGLDTKRGADTDAHFFTPGNLEALPAQRPGKGDKKSTEGYSIEINGIFLEECGEGIGCRFTVEKATIASLQAAKSIDKGLEAFCLVRDEEDRQLRIEEEKERRQAERDRIQEKIDRERRKQLRKERRAESELLKVERERLRVERQRKQDEEDMAKFRALQEAKFRKILGEHREMLKEIMVKLLLCRAGIMMERMAEKGIHPKEIREMFEEKYGVQEIFEEFEEHMDLDSDDMSLIEEVREEVFEELREFEEKIAKHFFVDKMKVDQEMADILGVEPDVDERTLKVTYRKLALKYHPDKWRSDSEHGMTKEDAQEHFKSIQNAYDHLQSRFDDDSDDDDESMY